MINELEPLPENHDPLLPEVKTYNGLFDEISKINKDDIIIRPNCKFCIHPARADAEAYFEKTRSIPPIVKFFENYQDQNPDTPKMSAQNCRSHLMSHYTEQEQYIWKREYADRVKTHMNYKIDMDKRFEGMAAILQEQLLTIVSNPMLDELKKADVAIKIVKQIIDIGVTQAKLRGEFKSVNMLIEKFQSIWVHVADQTKENPLAHKAIMDGISVFESEMENINLLSDKE